MEILERGPLLIELSGLLFDAATTGGRVVFVGGEAGVGKTVLASRLAEMVRPSCRVLEGACDPLTTPRPLAPLLDVAGQLGPRWTRRRQPLLRRSSRDRGDVLRSAR